MKLDLCTIDWAAIGSIATAIMAIATFWTIYANKKQFKELKKQSFETTLFTLFQEVKKIQNSISNIPQSGRRIGDFRYGLDALKSEYDEFKRKCTTKEQDRFTGSDIKQEPTIDICKSKYIEQYNGMSNFGTYFRSLYRVIRYIDESEFTYREKYQYTSFIRAQLTDIELYWIFYNCTVGYGAEKFKPLIEKYILLKNMPIDELVIKEHINWLNKSAYEK